MLRLVSEAREYASMLRRTIAVALAVVVGSLMLGAPAGAQAPSSDPIVGVWQLNVERSVYSPGPRPPADLVDLRHFTPLDNGMIRFTQTTTNAQGQPTFGIGVFRVDGERHPVHNIQTLVALMTTGRASNLTRSYRRIDERSTEFVTYTDGVAGLPSVRVVLPSGDAYTETTRGTNAQGVAVNNVLLFDRLR